MKKQVFTELNQHSEQQLIAALVSNDDCAYEILVRQYSARMYAVSRRFFNLDDDAQECLQKAFIQVFKSIASFKKDARLATWLHRITVNEALMMIRQKNRQRTTSLEDLYQQYNEYGERTIFDSTIQYPNSVSQRNNLEVLFEKSETQLSLNKIIYQLPEKYCNVLLLRDIQEMSTRETAELLSLSEASVKTQLHRARLLLKAILEQHDKSNLENNWKDN